MTTPDKLFYYVKQNLGTDYNLIFEFFILFSRFEFALKRAGFCDSKASEVVDAIPNWDKFFKNEKEAIKKTLGPLTNSELILSPPKKQKIDEYNELKWVKADAPGDDYDKANVYVRRVRNNLFHGGKYNIENDDPLRNSKLINEATRILKLLATVDVLKASFEDDLFK